MRSETERNTRGLTDGESVTLPRGIGLAILAALISGVAVFVGAAGVKEFSSPAVYTTLRNTGVGVTLLALLFRPSALREVRRLAPRQGLGLLLLGVIGGSIPFVLFFEGLSQARSGDAAFIQKTLFLWVAVLGVLFLRERLGAGQLIALGLLLVSAVLLGGPGSLRLGTGELLVLIATLFWSVEVVLAKRLLAGMSSSLAVTGRMGIGALVLLSYLALSGQLAVVGQLSLTQWAWVIGPSILLFGYVTTWYAALQRLPATTVTCVLTIGAPITAALAVVAGGSLPRPDALSGYAVLLVAVLLFAFILPREDALRSRGGRPAASGEA